MQNLKQVVSSEVTVAEKFNPETVVSLSVAEFNSGEAVSDVSLCKQENSVNHGATPPPPPPPPPPHYLFSRLTKFGKNGLLSALFLASCGLVFSPQTALGQTCTKHANSYQAGSGSCASGDRSTAAGYSTFALARSSVSIGRSNAARGELGVAMGVENLAAGATSSAMGVFNTATGVRSSAWGFAAWTETENEMAFGYTDGYARSIATFALDGVSTYRFTGLSIPETMLSGIPDPTTGVATTAQYEAYQRALRTQRATFAHRVVQVDGNGVLQTVDFDARNVGTASQDSGGTAGNTIYQRIASVRSASTANAAASAANAAAIGTAEQDSGGSGTIYERLHSLRSQLANSGYDDSEVRGLIGKNRELASQGVALSNALASLPKALLPGERLRLGIGVGSFDGKSGTAIGLMGKFGASTLLNAGFSTGGGESSTQVGISWGW